MAYTGTRRKPSHFVRNATFGAILALWALFVIFAFANNLPIKALATIAPNCATEDQTGFCAWNAQTSGNGQGDSFLVIGIYTIKYDN